MDDTICMNQHPAALTMIRRSTTVAALPSTEDLRRRQTDIPHPTLNSRASFLDPLCHTLFLREMLRFCYGYDTLRP